MNPYEELGVAPDATPEQINAAYRRKARAAHPDAGGNRDAFARLSRAVAILRDPQRRETYDRTGNAEDQPQGPMAAHVLAEAFSVAMQQHDPRHVDLIATVDTMLAGRLNEIKAERSKTLGKQRRNADAMTRLIRKADQPGSNILGNILAQAADDLGRELSRMDEIEALITEARELAKGWTWKVEPRPMQTTWFTTTPAGSTIA